MPQYSGAHYYTTFNGGASRTALADNIKGALVNAGWTVASGASGDWKLDSGITDNGLQCRVRVYDPGSGNNAVSYCSKVDDSLPLNAVPNLYEFNAADTWHFYGNPFFATMHVLPWPGGRKGGMFGVGWTPDFFHDGSPNECIASVFQGYNEPNSGISFFSASPAPVLLLAKSYGVIWNAAKQENSSAAGWRTFVNMPLLWATGRTDIPHAIRWAVDDSYQMQDALIQWSMIGADDNTDTRIRHIPYDMIIAHGAFEAGDEITWDGYIWRAITHNNANATLFCLKEPA